jgi:hypothetical protein
VRRQFDERGNSLGVLRLRHLLEQAVRNLHGFCFSGQLFHKPRKFR